MWIMPPFGLAEKEAFLMKKRVIVITVVLTALLVGTTSFITYHFLGLQRDKEMQERINDLQQSIDSLQENNSALRQELTQVTAIKESYKGKVAFLTFDDGPSVYTSKLLDTLEAEGVHATFFIVGTNAEKFPDVVKREYADGNAVGIHCWDHDFSVCYASVDAFFNDFNHIKSFLTTFWAPSRIYAGFPEALITPPVINTCRILCR